MTSLQPLTEGSTEPDSLLNEFLVDANLQGLTDRTLSTYRSLLEYFLDWIDIEPAAVDKGASNPVWPILRRHC